MFRLISIKLVELLNYTSVEQRSAYVGLFQFEASVLNVVCSGWELKPLQEEVAFTRI